MIHFTFDSEKSAKIEAFLYRINEILDEIIKNDEILIVFQQVKILFLTLISFYSMYCKHIDFAFGETFDNIIKQFFNIANKVTNNVKF